MVDVSIRDNALASARAAAHYIPHERNDSLLVDSGGRNSHLRVRKKLTFPCKSERDFSRNQIRRPKDDNAKHYFVVQIFSYIISSLAVKLAVILVVRKISGSPNVHDITVTCIFKGANSQKRVTFSQNRVTFPQKQVTSSQKRVTCSQKSMTFSQKRVTVALNAKIY